MLKPFDNENLELVIRKTLELERFRSENLFLKEQVGESWAAEDLFLALPSMREVADLHRQGRAEHEPRADHRRDRHRQGAGGALHPRPSPRRDELFVPLNCAALPGELLEAELFGHARGAFTGADRDRQGKFEIADGGTLFLDEIGDMPLALQAKLLRVLEDAVVEPLGTNQRIRVDVRVISATNQDLERGDRREALPQDLYYRLNTFEIHLPPLRERPDDIDVLAPLFLDRFAREIGKGPLRALRRRAGAAARATTGPATCASCATSWSAPPCCRPSRWSRDRFFASMIQTPARPRRRPRAKPPDEPPDGDADLPLGEAVERFERRVILHALDETNDNKAEAARRLGISERNLWYKLKKHGL